MLKDLLIGKGLRATTERGNCYANDTVLVFVVAFTDKSIEFVENCNLTWKHVLYTQTGVRMLFDHKCEVRGKPIAWRLGLHSFRNVNGLKFAPLCVSETGSTREGPNL